MMGIYSYENRLEAGGLLDRLIKSTLIQNTTNSV